MTVGELKQILNQYSDNANVGIGHFKDPGMFGPLHLEVSPILNIQEAPRKLEGGLILSNHEEWVQECYGRLK